MSEALHSRLDIKRFQLLLTGLLKYLFFEQIQITPSVLAEQLYYPFKDSDLREIQSEIKGFELVINRSILIIIIIVNNLPFHW